MIRVTSAAEVKPDTFVGWSLDLWIGHVSECEINALKSKAALRELVSLLPGACIFDLAMEPLMDGEPIGEGFLIWNEQTYEIVVNTFDGAVFLNHPKPEPLTELLSMVGSSIIVKA
jgi:hypothetical protein